MKIKTTIVAACVAMAAVSCSETPSKEKPEAAAQETPEQIKKAEKTIQELDATIQEIDSKEADLNAALEELNF